jgi:primosomal protein N'
MSDNPRQIVCTNCLQRQRQLRKPCEKCGSKKLTHVRFLIQQHGPDWKLILEPDKDKVH